MNVTAPPPTNEARIRYERIRALGLVAEAVEALLDAPDSLSVKARHVLYVARCVRDPGACSTPELGARIRDLLEAAAEPLTPEVEELLQAPRAAVGIARFPVALRNVREVNGAIACFVVDRGLPAARVEDAEFLRAVEEARALAEAHFGHDNLHGASWTVWPTALAKHCGGQSVGLAAYLAFASHAQGSPLPADTAWSGVLGQGHWLAPRAEGFEAKVQAVRRRPYLGTLHWPGADAIEGVEGIKLRREAQFNETRALYLPAPQPTEMGQLRVLALLDAAEFDGLTRNQLHDALELWEPHRGSRDELDLGVSLRELDTDGWLESRNVNGQAVYRLRHASRRPELMRRAHAALAALYANAAPQTPPALLRLCHLASRAAEEPEVWGEVTVAARQVAPFLETLGPVDEVLGRFRRLGARIPSDGYDTLLRGLLLGEGDAPLLALALIAETVTAPVARLAKRLADVRTGVDRLLWIQALIEAGLHLTTLPALVKHPNAPESESLRTRPSLGNFESALKKLQRESNQPLPWLAAIARHPRFVADWNERLHHTGGWLDRHGESSPGRAITSVGGGDSHARELSRTAAREAFDFVATLALPNLVLSVRREDGSVVPLVGAHQFEAACDGDRYLLSTPADSAPLDVTGWLLPADPHRRDASIVAFHRGFNEVDARERWFAFDSGQVLFAPRNEHAPITEVSRLAHAASNVRNPAPDLVALARDRLPLPVARACNVLKPGAAPLARLGGADLVFASLLRLLVLPTLDEQVGNETKRLLGRPIKRNLVNRAIEVARAGNGHPLLAPFLRPDYQERAHDLVHLLEWLEHSGGPLHHQDRAIEDAVALAAWLACGEDWPWVSGARLVGGGLEWMGVVPRTLNDSTGRPDTEPAKKLHWIHGSDTWPLAHGATVEPAIGARAGSPTIWLVRDEANDYALEASGAVIMRRRAGEKPPRPKD